LPTARAASTGAAGPRTFRCLCLYRNKDCHTGSVAARKNHRGERKGTFTEKDLKLAKDSLLNSFLFSFQSSGQIVRSRLSVEFDGLPADYFETYRERIRRVTLDDLKRAANRWLDPGQASILVLGNSREFGGGLESFGEVTMAP
jgi:Zn-dependent M16 (insulinase) family peptidase